ncbi:MAG: DNA methyltransferase [Nanoarchaeota archaeon]|nr:DNA methyltransferase [Nanoarchaeota archaeon]
MKYLFILGRNIELSQQEIHSYLNRKNNKILSETLDKNALFINLENKIPQETIKELGGILRIGEIIAYSNNITKELEKFQIYNGESNKLNYVIWDFSKNYSEVEDYIKQRFKSEKLKATIKHLTDKIDSQNKEEFYMPSSKLLNEEYFIFQENGTDYFGKIIQQPNYEEIKKRDMEKPVRRESLAISPRLAKILVNLAEPKQTLLDPFCGVGTIIQEALLQDINTIGIDKDKKAIEGAEKNLKWLNFLKEKYELINSDSTKINIPEISAIATEPDLGQILKKIPQKHEAEKTLINFKELIIQVINNLKEKVSGKIVFTSPYIRIGKKRLSCNIENICERTNYRLIKQIPEFRENQIIGRMIYILEN